MRNGRVVMQDTENFLSWAKSESMHYQCNVSICIKFERRRESYLVEGQQTELPAGQSFFGKQFADHSSQFKSELCFRTQFPIQDF